MAGPKILAFAGSTRRESFNQKLIKVAAAAAEAAGAEVTFLDLGDLDLPLYNQDDEEANGLPPGALQLKELMSEHQGFLISSPEYNSSITPLLKNAIDWASRKTTPDEPALSVYTGKVAGIMSASPGALGGLRGLVHLRAILQNIGVLVVPKQMAISAANQAFAEDGALTNPKQQQAIAQIAETVTDILKKLSQ